MSCIRPDTLYKGMLALRAVAISVGQHNNVHSGIFSCDHNATKYWSWRRTTGLLLYIVSGHEPVIVSMRHSRSLRAGWGWVAISHVCLRSACYMYGTIWILRCTMCCALSILVAIVNAMAQRNVTKSDYRNPQNPDKQ